METGLTLPACRRQGGMNHAWQSPSYQEVHSVARGPDDTTPAHGVDRRVTFRGDRRCRPAQKWGSQERPGARAACPMKLQFSGMPPSWLPPLGVREKLECEQTGGRRFAGSRWTTTLHALSSGRIVRSLRRFLARQRTYSRWGSQFNRPFFLLHRQQAIIDRIPPSKLQHFGTIRRTP